MGYEYHRQNRIYVVAWVVLTLSAESAWSLMHAYATMGYLSFLKFG